MKEVSKNTIKALLREVDRIAYIASLVAIIVLSSIYFLLWPRELPYLSPMIREFVLTLITEIIPVLLVFVLSYALFRRIQSIKSEEEGNELAEKIADKVGAGLRDEIQNLERKLGLSADFVFDDLPMKEATGEIYWKATDIVNRANKEILILWYHRPSPKLPGDVVRSESYIASRNQFYSTIMRKCEEHKRDKFFYRRVLQLVEPVQGGVVRSSALPSPMAEHCREVLDFTRCYPDAAMIKHTSVYLEQTFMLVDEHYIVWEIDAIDPETEQEYFDSLVIFEDLDKDFVIYLKRIFEKIEHHGTKIEQVLD